MDGLFFMATPNGLEPSTSSVTGWRANRLHHRARTRWIIADKFKFVKTQNQKIFVSSSLVFSLNRKCAQITVFLFRKTKKQTNFMGNLSNSGIDFE